MDERRIFPPLGAPENDILSFRDRLINRWSVYRNRHMGRIALAMWYHIGKQWAELDYEAAFDGVRGAVLQSMADDEKVRPITNIVDAPVEQEVIALVKRQWVPKVTPESDDPSIRAAAQVANDMLNYRLEQLAWPEKRHQLAMHFAVTGTGLLYSGWDKSYLDLKTIGAPDAVWCRGCGTKLYSSSVPISTLQAGIGGQPVSHLDSIAEDETGENATLSYCPTCPTAHELEPYEPNEQEAQYGNDVFGRPLGVLEPRGGSTIEVDLPFEFYPQNGGIRVTPESLVLCGRRKIRSLEWLEERAPHIVDQINPDPINELLYSDPFLGDYSTLDSWSGSYDAGILDQHVNVDEMWQLPSLRYPLGRYVICTKNKVVEDANLLEKATIEGETVYVPRVTEAAARFKLRLTDFWGTALPDNIISPQNQRNGILGQLIETRLRLGAPNLMMHPEMWADDPVMDSPGPGVGSVLFFKPSISNPEFTKPEVLGGILMPDSVYNEINLIDTYVQREVGPQDPSIGMAPKNVGTTSGIERLVEQDELSRSLREDELVRAAEKTWSHLLHLEWVLRVDSDIYRVLGPNKAWKYEQYKGTALRGQTEVKIERGSFIGKSIVRREAAREALADQVLVIDGPVARKRVLENYGLDTNINEDTNNQVDHAERVWVDYRDKGLIRTQDTLDEPTIHYQVLGAHLRTDEGEQRADEAGWEEINNAIAGWEDELHNLQILEAKTIAFYGGQRLKGDAAAEAYAQAMVAYDDSMKLYTQQQGLADKITALADPLMPPPPSMPPPSKPPMPIEIPVLLQSRILIVWQSMLEAAKIQPRPEAANYVKFRALVEAYKLTITGGFAQSSTQAILATMGPPAGMLPMPAPTAPGSGATNTAVDKGSSIVPPGPPNPSGGNQGGKPEMQPVGAMPEGGKR